VIVAKENRQKTIKDKRKDKLMTFKELTNFIKQRHKSYTNNQLFTYIHISKTKTRLIRIHALRLHPDSCALIMIFHALQSDR